MKLLLEVLVAIVLHPLAYILMLVNLARRGDLSFGVKVAWGVVGILWGLGPILYLLLGGGALW